MTNRMFGRRFNWCDLFAFGGCLALCIDGDILPGLAMLFTGITISSLGKIVLETTAEKERWQ